MENNNEVERARAEAWRKSLSKDEQLDIAYKHTGYYHITNDNILPLYRRYNPQQPQREAEQTYSIEEAARKFAFSDDTQTSNVVELNLIHGFIEGARWQLSQITDSKTAVELEAWQCRECGNDCGLIDDDAGTDREILRLCRICFNSSVEAPKESVDSESNAMRAIKQIPQQPQVQYDTQRQLQELRIAANKLGLYDAADFLSKPK